MARSLLLIIVLPLVCAAEPTKIKVTNLRPTMGFLAVSVFDDETAFPEKIESAVWQTYIPIEANEMSLNIDVPKGEYAVAVMHDKNGDRKMNFNWIGIPSEGFGFSNNPTIYFGPPSFQKSTVEMPANEVSIELKYF